MIVRKYGGSSLAQPEQIKAIAQSVAALAALGEKIVLVVSAMGKSTDHLHHLARQVSPVPVARELDMLLSTGERVSMALMSMALHDLNCRSLSFTGSQAGILTSSSHTSAQIIDIKAFRLEEAIARGEVVVLAGFQGVCPQTKEITTLGRGGSDTTAVAVAGFFGSRTCEIRKEVEGVFSADPNIVREAEPLSYLNYEHLLMMTFSGAKVLHYRSVELALRLKVPLWIGLAHGEGRFTQIGESPAMFELGQVLAVNERKNLLLLTTPAASLHDGYEAFARVLKEASLPWPQIIHADFEASHFRLWIAESEEALNSYSEILRQKSDFAPSATSYSSLTLTCHGLVQSDLCHKLLKSFAAANIEVTATLFAPMGVTFITPAEKLINAVKLAHQHLGPVS